MAEELRAGPGNGLTDVSGLLVGHHQRDEPPYLTGTTVVVAPEGAVAGVDVRGGAPGTRETDALDPGNLVDRIQAVVLTGGSAFGLDAASGVMGWLEEQGLGFPIGAEPGRVVPIVPAAVLFDLGRGGDWRARPDAGFGYRAAAGASAGPVAEGCVGAGTGAVAGSLKGGIGTASVRLSDGAVVAALVAVNASGEVFDPGTGRLWARALLLPGELALAEPPEPGDPADPARPAEAEVGRHAARPRPARGPATSTTIGVVATDAALSRPEARRLAQVAHDGLARAVRPAHSLLDGDTFFALSTGRRDLAGDLAGDVTRPRTVALNSILAAGADCVSRAVVHAVVGARSAAGLPSYREAFPSALA